MKLWVVKKANECGWEFRIGMFIRRKIKLHSGGFSDFKIECDVLTDEDLETLAYLGHKIVGDFSAIEGVPAGGIRFAKFMEKYKSNKGPLLIVDDVMTTGNSMEEQRAGRGAVGLVIFNRSSFICDWIHSIFDINPILRYTIGED